MGAVQPFDFGAPSEAQPGGLGNVQPFDFGATPAPAQPGGLGNVQPFDFGATPAPGGPGDLESVDDFVDFLNATEEATPVPGTPGGAGEPGGVTPFSFEGLDLGGPPGGGADLGLPGGLEPFSFDNLNLGGAETLPGVPATPAQPVPMPPPPASVQPFSPEEFEFQPFAFGQEPGGGPADFGGPGGIPGMEGLPDIQPFSFENLNLGAAGAGAAGTNAFGRRSGDRSEAEYEETADTQERGFSWQERPSTPARREPREEEVESPTESIFAKAKRRKEELEAAMRQEAAAAAPPVPPEVPVELEVAPTDIWPTFEEEEGGVAAPVPAQPPAAAAPPPGAAFGLLEPEPPAAEEEAGPEFDMESVQPFDFSAIEAPAAPEPFDFASLDVSPAAPPTPLGAVPDLTPGQPEQLWSTPVAPAAPAGAASEAREASDDFDFSGLPQFDLASLGLSPEEQAYLTGQANLGLESAPGAPAVPAEPAQPGEAESLPSWLTGGPAGRPETAATPALTDEPLPGWLGGSQGAGATPPAEPAFAADFGAAPAPAEPAIAEVFGGDETQAWPAPMEPEVGEPEVPEVPAAPAPEIPPSSWPQAVELEPATAAHEEALAPPLPDWHTLGAPAPTLEPAPPITVPVAPRIGTGVLGAPPPAAPAGEGLEDLLRHLQENPTDAAARLVLAGVYEEREDFRRAMDEYRMLIKGRHVPANLVEIVVGNLRDLAEELPDDPMVHRLLGDAYRKAGMYQAAISQYTWLLSQSVK
jgi:hypothetical protein